MQQPTTEATTMKPRYEVAKFGERSWGIVYRLDAHTSFDQKVRYPTKRKATSMAALLNAVGA